MLETQGNLTWIVPDVLAAMGRPYDLRKAVELFKDAGIGVVVSLTETALNTDILAEFDIEYHHMPVDDFGAPDSEQIDRFVSIVRGARAGRKRSCTASPAVAAAARWPPATSSASAGRRMRRS